MVIELLSWVLEKYLWVYYISCARPHFFGGENITLGDITAGVDFNRCGATDSEKCVIV